MSRSRVAPRLPRPVRQLLVATLLMRAAGFITPMLALWLNDRGVSAGGTGLILALVAIGQAISQPVAGWLSDRSGRRAILAFSATATAAGAAALAVGSSPGVLGAAAIVWGVGSDAYRPVLRASLADLTPAASRQRAFMLQFWVTNVGFGVAGLTLSLADEVGYRALIALDAMIFVVCTAAVTAVMAARSSEGTPSASPPGLAESVQAIASDRRFAAVLAVNVVQAVAFLQLLSGLPLALADEGLGPGSYGPLAALNAVGIVVLQPLLARWMELQSRSLLVSIGLCATGVGFASHCLADSALEYGLGVGIWTVGEVLVSAGLAAVAVDVAPPGLRGSYQGAFGFSWSLAAIAAPALSGALLAAGGGGATLWLPVGAATILTGLAVARTDVLSPAPGNDTGSG